MIRYCTPFVIKDLQKKMVFMGGPRQVGKTTLAKSLLELPDFHIGQYFNWDLDEDRLAIINKQWNSESSLLVFDELHKYPRWKQWIKGVYDTRPDNQNYMVTGSARLDVYRRGGDSLMGRYHYWRLHPFTIDEFPETLSVKDAYERLIMVGGFPEPFIENDLREARRWRRDRFDRIIREDIRDLELIRNIELLRFLVDALRERVSGHITLSSLAEDLQVSSKTIKHWISIIEKMYIAFTIYPLTKNVPRAIQKPIKVYFYDNADVAEKDGLRLENLVATTLLKRLHFIEDYYGYRCSLHYIRDKESREVDFVTVIDNKIDELIEVKHSDTDISSALKYYAEKLNPRKALQLVGTIKNPYVKDKILVTNPISYFTNPPWYS
jgi:uncharacterized protein